MYSTCNLGESHLMICITLNNKEGLHESGKGSAFTNDVTNDRKWRKRKSPIDEMVKLLVIWMQDQIDRRYSIHSHDQWIKSPGFRWVGWGRVESDNFQCKPHLKDTRHANFYNVQAGGKSASANWKTALILTDNLDMVFGKENYMKEWTSCFKNTGLW